MASELPRIPKSGLLTIPLLILMSFGFYLLVIANIVGIVAAGVYLVILTPQIIRVVHSLAGLEMLGAIYVGIGGLMLASIQGLMSWPDLTITGIIPNRSRHQKLYTLIREVGNKVGCPVFDSVVIVPGFRLSITEDVGRFRLPGTGKRKLIIGLEMLNFTTADQFSFFIAHEYSHFLRKDTSLSVYLMLCSRMFEEVLKSMGEVKGHLLNPFYYLFWVYVILFELVYAVDRRRRELAADRFAAEAYGAREYGDAFIDMTLNSIVFSMGVMPEVVYKMVRGEGLSNISHLAAVRRREFAQVPDLQRKVQGSLSSMQTGVFDKHPANGVRLKYLNYPLALQKPNPPPRAIPYPYLDERLTPDLQMSMRSGPVSAAEEIFGVEEALKLQTSCTQIFGEGLRRRR